jgi:hypothetical protein
MSSTNIFSFELILNPLLDFEILIVNTEAFSIGIHPTEAMDLPVSQKLRFEVIV